MHFKNIPHLLFALYTQYKKYIYTAVIARPKNRAYGRATYSRILRTFNGQCYEREKLRQRCFKKKHIPLTVAFYEHLTVAFYEHSIVAIYQHLTVAFYEHLTVAFYEHLTVACYKHITVAFYKH